MTLPDPPTPLSEEERRALAEKFEEHEISEDQRERQQKYREKLKDKQS